MRILTFRDFAFRATHCLPTHLGAPAQTHWHSYVVRFWFTNGPDQEVLSALIESRYKYLHGADLEVLHPMLDTTDESLAKWFLTDVRLSCQEGYLVRVTVTNDGQRGAEVEA